MFEELEKKSTSAKNNIVDQKKNNFTDSSKENITSEKNENRQHIEDIFFDTDKPDIFKPKENQDSGVKDKEVEEEKDKKQALKKILILLSYLIFLLLLLGGFFVAYKILFKNDTIIPQGIEDNIEDITASGNDTDPSPDNTQQISDKEEDPVVSDFVEQEKNSQQDTDQDGLSDEEEKSLGLNINKNDSDDDGLFDREELRVYKTDPLNQDTDGDGYLDGAEVKNGFNPNGAGRLYNINQ